MGGRMGQNIIKFLEIRDLEMVPIIFGYWKGYWLGGLLEMSDGVRRQAGEY